MSFNKQAIISLFVFHGCATLGGLVYGLNRMPPPTSDSWYAVWIGFCILFSLAALGMAHLARFGIKRMK